jgi:hypothetical protein
MKAKHLTPGFFSLIGVLEEQALRNAGALVYTVGDAANLVKFNVSPDEFILKCLEQIKVFLHCLWLIKDHSIHPEMGFLQVTDGIHCQGHSNFLAPDVTTAKGQRETVVVTRDDLRQTTDFMTGQMREHFNHGTSLAIDGEFYLRNPSLGSQKGVNRLQRSFYFASAARDGSDLGMKIVSYCTALEALFSTDSSELTHKVAHRIAVFLGGGPQEKTALFNFIKKAYGIRSKVVHGDTLGGDAASQIPIVCQELDNLVRKILAKIFNTPTLAEIFDKPKEDLEKYFLESSFT